MDESYSQSNATAAASAACSDAKRTRTRRACDEAAADLPTDPQELLALLCKALGNPVRLKILSLLLERGGCACGELVNTMPLAQSTVSQHLQVLREAGIVLYENESGRAGYYCVCPDALGRVRALLKELEESLGTTSAQEASAQ